MSIRYENFKKDLIEKGQPGEAACYEWLITKFDDVQDVSKNSEWYGKCVDFICWKLFQDYDVYIDVKNDSVMNTSGNFAIEMVTDVSNGKIGWYPKAVNASLGHHFILYRNAITGETYILPIDAITDYINKYNCREAISKDMYNGICTKKSLNKLIPIQDMVSKYRIYKFIC